MLTVDFGERKSAVGPAPRIRGGFYFADFHARIKGKKPIILVATAGGGIQAGAWTAEVLSGLEDLSKNTWKTSYGFADSLTLVSSVSGGATGSMYFLNLYRPDTAAIFQDQEVKKMNGDVKESSLDDVAWALVYCDLSRIFLPFLNDSAGNKFVDRGYALEETWSNRGGIHANLSNWRAGVNEGNRPAVIFNSTVSEIGEPLLLSTTDLAEESKPPRTMSFYSLYHNTECTCSDSGSIGGDFPVCDARSPQGFEQARVSHDRRRILRQSRCRKSRRVAR